MRLAIVLRVLLATYLLALSGCASVQWTTVSSDPYAENGYKVQLPPGWRRFSSGPLHRLVATRDGIPLQYIVTEEQPLKEAFKVLKKPLPADASPQQIAEEYISWLKMQPRLESMQVIENGPATLSGQDALRLHLGYRSDGLRIERLVYGAVRDGFLYTLTYEAPVLRYFKRDQPTFETVAKSFEFTARRKIAH